MKRLVLALTAVVIAVATASASATVVGLTGFTTASPADSNNKSVTGACPQGTRLTGAGGAVGGSGQVIFDDLTPSADLTSVTVKGAEDETGFAGDWVVEAVPTCSAAPPGLERVSTTSPLSSSNKSVTATCPSGKRVVGTGADINAGSGQVGIDDMRPNTELTSVTVQALEDQNGHAGFWNVTAYAVCANLSGLERVSGTSALNSDANKVAFATCPSGKRVIGLGSDINAGQGQVQQTQVSTGGDRTSMGVGANEDEDSFSGPWSVTAYAICSPIATRAQQTFGPDSPAVVNMGVGCPIETRLTGLGMEFAGALGQVSTDYIYPDTTFGGLSGREDPTGFAGNWRLTAYGICGTPLAGHEIVSTVTASDSISPKSTAAFCPAGKRVVGGGVYNSGASEWVDDIVPNAALTSVTATVTENEAGTTSSWLLTTYAVCADPLPGLELVRAASPLDSEEVAAATATCPAGKYLIGTGVEKLPGAEPNILLDDFRPSITLTAVTVTALESELGKDGDWGVAAYAICANR